MKRQEANLKILEILNKLVKQYPDLRFGQLMLYAGVVEICLFADDNYEEQGWADEFYVESVDILKRVKKLQKKHAKYTKK